jgi:hypothetical protein
MEESCSKAEIGGLKFKITGPLIEMNQFLSAIGNGKAGNRAFPGQHLPLMNSQTLHNSPCDQQAVHSFFDDLGKLGFRIFALSKRDKKSLNQFWF